MPAKKKKATKRKVVAKKVTRSSSTCMTGNCMLNPVSLGLSFGVLLGLYVLLLGLLMQAGVQTVWVSPEIYDFIVSAYPGFEATTNGSVIGLIWGFIDGFVGGILIALLYNFFQKKACCK